MRRRRLGSTGLEVSEIGLGTWQFGGEWGRAFEATEVARIVARAGELGVNLIDTAECYGDHRAEELIGRAIAGDRARWVVATKFGHRFHSDRMSGDWSPVDVRSDHWSAPEVVEQLDRSLEALGTNHVDILQMHGGPDEAFFDNELWAALREEVARGRVRRLGVSLPGTSEVDRVDAAPEFGISVVQVTYNRIDRAAEDAVLPRCQELGLGVIVREPLANGFLSGKYTAAGGVRDASDWRAQLGGEEEARRLAVVEEVEREELPEGTPMAAWAIGWCLRHPAVSAVVPGARSLEQLEANARAACAAG